MTSPQKNKCLCKRFHFTSQLVTISLFADWSILYVTVIIFGIIMAIGGIVWGICFCMGRLVLHATQFPKNGSLYRR